MALPAGLRKRVAAWLQGDALPPAVEIDAAAAAAVPDSAARRVLDMRGVGALMCERLTAAREATEGGLIEVETPLGEVAEELGLAAPKYAGPALVMDLETLALRSAPIFLVGILDLAAGRARQILAADYSGEVEMLTAAAASLREASAVVTYNGTTFDLPYLRERMAYWRLGPLEHGEHYDLLLILRSRRTDKKSLKLTAVEERLLGRTRLADVDGAALPERYKEFMDGGGCEVIAPALAHNLMDLWSCGDIHALLGEADEGRERQEVR